MNYSEQDVNKVFRLTDIYLDLTNIEHSFYYPDLRIIQKEEPEKSIEKEKTFFDTNDPITMNVLESFRESVLKRLEKDNHKKDHKVIFHNRHFRCYEIPSLTGKLVACRQMPVDFMDISETGMDRKIVQELLHPRLKKGGLVIISGAPGNGKTTTCAATIQKWLEGFGGLCITVEDPIEIKLQGEHGKGMCLQTEVENQQGFAPAVRGIMRAYPTGQTGIMLIGETRDSETATEAVRSSLDGRLVITTMHAQTPLEAIKRFISFAKSGLGEEVHEMLAISLRLVLGQKLVNNRLMTQILVNEIDVSGAIKHQKVNQLKTHLETQERKIKNNEKFHYSK